MISFPNCKINIGLHITGKREDGFHNIETIFYPLPFCDCLEFILAEKNNDKPIFTTTGLPIAGDASANLCIKAWKILKQDFPQIPAVQIHLHKIIPMGAGLGGGSANGAFMLSMLNEKYNLQLTQSQLCEYALKLGSDCPLFIINAPCYGTGRGEVLQPINLALSQYYFVLVNPNIHINTGWAFSQLQPKIPDYNLQQAIQKPIDFWKEIISNDFEKVVVKSFPVIAEIKTTLYNSGALYAAMTGSGSTVFGIFDSQPSLTFLSASYFIKIIPPAAVL